MTDALLELACIVVGAVVGGLLCLIFYGIGHDHGIAEERAYGNDR